MSGLTHKKTLLLIYRSFNLAIFRGRYKTTWPFMVFVIMAPYAIQLNCLAMLFVDRGLAVLWGHYRL